MCPNPTNPTFITSAPVRIAIGTDPTEPDAERKYDALPPER
jgi:hypothetical protein